MGNSLKHIGIVGCSAEGAALCYKTICTESPKTLGQHVHPEISMHTHSLADYVDCLNSNDITGIGELMLSSAQNLKNQGADFLICPDNTIHQAFKYVEERSPLPWLHIAQVVVESAKHQDFRKLGILGTKWLVESNVYPEKIAAKGLAWERPSNEEIDEIGRIIMAQLVYGIFKTESVTYFQKVIRRLKDKGCDAIILGCTEIPLIIDDSNSVLPTLDSNRLLAEAAIRLASEHTSV
ncbi:amino acid racemase [Vibrio sp. OCN044]|uniref:Amino acid racemase n=1 Tax=Vibrio tetraodonis subsp. pristinus TaxID=2695891 RepID=A0A6L8LWJ4_9VIBR|nr:amino acid racemase [Vibrio tetraodonis]MYM59853.1 amino acid racemase [Vibrio tetraodonis subsp. pristinus]